jgi:hypothetical protein
MPFTGGDSELHLEVVSMSSLVLLDSLMALIAHFL